LALSMRFLANNVIVLGYRIILLPFQNSLNAEFAENAEIKLSLIIIHKNKMLKNNWIR